MKNLDKLNELKDLDIAQISKVLSDNLNPLIKVILIIVSLMLAGMIFNDHNNKEQVIRLQMSQIQQKLNAIKDSNEAKKDLNSFESSLPSKINEFELISLISKYAKLYNIKIPSLSPAESKDMGLFDNININFSAFSSDFKNMVLFLRMIEKSDFPLRVDSWTGSEGTDGQINFNIAISAVMIHS